MVKRWLLPGAMIAAALMLVTGFVIGPRSIAAQDMSASPAAGLQVHPAHIHTGTCDTLGEVVFPLMDVTQIDDMTRPEMGGMMGSPEADASAEQLAGDATAISELAETDDMGMSGNVVAESTTVVDASLDDIVGSEHAINVHESMENIQNYIACGDITGTPEDSMLEIQLNELNGSGYEGTATLTDNGDNTVTVEVQLMMAEDRMNEGMATPTS